MALKPIRSLLSTVPRRAGVTKTHEAFTYPAPVGGLDFMTPLTHMDQKAAIKASNVLVRNYGIEFRAGWRRWASLIPGEVRTIMPYNPPRGLAPSATAKLFAACSNGSIYDVTAQTNESTIPPVAVVIPGQLEPGEFSWVNFATPTNNFLCVVSSGGGYWTFDAVGGWINQTAAISGAGSAAAINFDFVMSWKNRLWFIKDLTADTYFLGVNSITGASSAFDFGPLLVHGGDIKAMASWTVDGGDGIDDKLIIVGSEGDLLIYEGTDPSSAAAFRIVGRWFIGRPPNGRRFMERYGGDLGMITQFGIVFLSRLLRQSGVTVDQDSSASFKINPVLANFVRNTLLQQYWEIRYLPQLEAIFINMPDAVDTKNRQWVMDVNSRAWSTFDGVPMLTCENFQSELYFGTVDGIVGKAFQENAASDGILSTGAAGNDIGVDVQTAFVPNGDPVRYKRFLHANLTFQGQVKPAISAQINSDWGFESTPGSPIFMGIDPSLWDVALWDQGLWSGGPEITFRGWFGVSGLGYFGSLRFTGRGLPRTYFVNWTFVTEPGGLM